MTGESRELGRTTAREAEAKDVAVAEGVAAQAQGMEGSMEEDMEEAVPKEVRLWPMASIFQTSLGPSQTRNGPLSSENMRHVHEERERRRNSEGPAREIHAATAATAVIDGSSITFDEPLPDNNNGGAGRAASFSHGAYRGR